MPHKRIAALVVFLYPVLAFGGDASGQFAAGKRPPIKPKYAAAYETRDQRDARKTAVEVVLSEEPIDVLPEAEEIDVELKPSDLQIDVFRSSGPGGQSVNTADSAVRIRHIPTGMVVQCQDERSQLKNKAKALKVLRARLLDMELQAQQRKLAQTRKSMVSSGDRSAKIRTYNFPQGRVTEHRIGLTLYRLPSVLEGDLDEVVDGLFHAEQAERLAASGEAAPNRS